MDVNEIRPGLRVWTSTVGTHRVHVGDVQAGAVTALMGGDCAVIVYGDPPWGEGNLRYWRTHAKDTTQPRWTDFVAAWTTDVHRVLRPDGAMFVEMGVRWSDDFARSIAALGRPLRARWTTHYKAGSRLLPNALLYFGPALASDFDPSALRGAALPRACVGAAKEALGITSGIVLDPCCGKGYTARAAVAHGLTFRGNELNPERAAVTVAWLEKHAR